MTAAQAIARGLGLDQESRRLGYRHATLGRPWSCPDGYQLLGYSSGYAEGEADVRLGYHQPAAVTAGRPS